MSDKGIKTPDEVLEVIRRKVGEMVLVNSSCDGEKVKWYVDNVFIIEVKI